jgi:diphthine-ammonia ligase
VTMRLASLFSGGKDSTYATHLVSEGGDDVAYLITILPKRDDSWMFHTVNIHLAPIVAHAMGLESIIVDSSGEKEQELKDLREVLSDLDIDGIVTGAIASTYQRSRVDRICEELNLKHATPLWGKDGFDLLGEMISEEMVVMITAVAAHGLNQHWLGRTLDWEAARELRALSRRFGVDVCGEGGEMETLVLDAPWFRSRLEVTRARRVWDGMRGSYLVEDVRLQPKSYDA